MTEWIEIGTPGWNRVTEFTVTWTGLGLLRDVRGRYTVHHFQAVDRCETVNCSCPTSTHYRKASQALRKATDDDLVVLPMCRDNYQPPSDPCERCGKVDYLDNHHWAPRHLFGDDCNNWPTAWLCPTCHREWHAKVTPEMHRRTAG